MTDQELIKRLRVTGNGLSAEWLEFGHDRREAVDRIKELEDRNKELTLQLLATSGQAADALDKLTECKARLGKAVGALVAEREENLWNAYNIGIERDGRWSDACMSDAEWLVAQCGLDPEFKDHDANVIKQTIPIVARAVLAELEGK
jgi:hypothetical protein